MWGFILVIADALAAEPCREFGLPERNLNCSGFVAHTNIPWRPALPGYDLWIYVCAGIVPGPFTGEEKLLKATKLPSLTCSHWCWRALNVGWRRRCCFHAFVLTDVLTFYSWGSLVYVSNTNSP